ALVKNNIVAHNSGGQLYGGGGFYFIGNDEEPIIVENNTIIGNHSETTGGAMRMWSSVVDVLNNIIWGNTQNSGGPLYGAGASSITYCDIEGGFTGEGNIDEYPAFADTTTCILTETSPCVDAGNPDIMYNDPEDPFNPGNALYPALGTLRNDMGAYGGGGSENWVVNDENLLKPCANKIFMQNFPNPFNPGTAISCHIPPAINDEFALVIYNIKGQLIRVMPLHQGCRTASETGENRYTFTWNGKDEQGNPVTSGIYFYRLTLPDSPTRKMLLMK
ncbi:MAG: hypothetical protein JXB60_03535, partial [Candidatus Cloacimonetes bacterium]|nr:hypothetical protein [Candidatus Cloacimonadota bacterium]